MLSVPEKGKSEQLRRNASTKSSEWNAIKSFALAMAGTMVSTLSVNPNASRVLWIAAHLPGVLGRESITANCSFPKTTIPTRLTAPDGPATTGDTARRT
jgi:hypothetical protein